MSLSDNQQSGVTMMGGVGFSYLENDVKAFVKELMEEIHTSRGLTIPKLNELAGEKLI